MVFKISCVMSIYKEPVWMIDRAIASMINQTYPLYEIIIVIDTPDRKDLAEYINKQYYNCKSPIKIIINRENMGLAKSLNIGISQASGDFICRMDADDESLLQRVEESVELMQHLKISFVTTRIHTVDEAGRDYEGLVREYPCNPEGIRILSKYVSCIVHPTWIFSKAIWERLGGYREELFSTQDYDFSLRAIKEGIKIATVKKELLNYTYRSDSISGKHKTKQIFLSLIIQENVLNGGPYNSELIESIRNEKNEEYLKFKSFYEKYKNVNGIIRKTKEVINGGIQCRFFRKLIINILKWKLLCRIYP